MFNTTLDKHAPIKEFTKKEEKDKLKPYVTKGIKKCMSVRDKIYKQMIKEKDQLIKTEKHKKCKKYWNKITNLLKKQVNRRITTNILKRIRKTAELYGLE